MGAASSCGDVFVCNRKHENPDELFATATKFDYGKDIDDAVLAATNKSISQEGNLITLLNLSVECLGLPNLDTFT